MGFVSLLVVAAVVVFFVIKGKKYAAEQKVLEEKKKAEAYLLNTDITSAYIQESESADTSFIPDF